MIANDNDTEICADFTDFMEMMMMQNAQMHQMVMQQMMLSAIPKNNNLPPIGATTEAQVGHCNSNLIKWL